MNVVIMCGAFFILGFIKAKIILSLPEKYQPAWFVVSVHGIFWVVTSVFVIAMYQGDVSLLWLYLTLWAVFLSALPGMIYLNYIQWQRWQCQQSEAAQDDLIEVLQHLVNKLDRVDDNLDNQVEAIANMIWVQIGPDAAEAFIRGIKELDKDADVK